MSLLPNLPDFKDISARVERGQGEIASRLEEIVALLDRLVEIMSVRALGDGFEPAALTALADVNGSSRRPVSAFAGQR